MTSPLLPYANAYLVITQQGAPGVVNGRIVTTAGNSYIIECYLKRQDSTGTSTGADYLPTQSNPGETLPGASGDVYLYRGYALRQAAAPSGYDATSDPFPTSLSWQQLNDELLHPGLECVHLQGIESPKASRIERATGKYGGTQIDELIKDYVGGAPLVVRSGDITG